MTGLAPRPGAFGAPNLSPPARPALAPEPVTRNATPLDAPAIADLTRAAWAAGAPADSSGRLETPQYVLRDLERGLALLVEAEGRLVAALRVLVTPHVWTLKRLAVHPERRNRGLGAFLMRSALSQARARGALDAQLAVRADQPGLAAYYRRLGFTVTPELRYSDANCANTPPVVMRCVLGDGR